MFFLNVKPLKAHPHAPLLFDPEFRGPRRVEVNWPYITSNRTNHPEVDAEMTLETVATRDGCDVTLGGSTTTYGRFRGAYRFENEDQAELFKQCCSAPPAAAPPAAVRPLAAFPDFVNECRVNGGISPTEAYRRFWIFFATYVTRA